MKTKLTVSNIIALVILQAIAISVIFSYKLIYWDDAIKALVVTGCEIASLMIWAFSKERVDQKSH